jgi:hypothetical protein
LIRSRSTITCKSSTDKYTNHDIHHDIRTYLWNKREAETDTCSGGGGGSGGSGGGGGGGFGGGSGGGGGCGGGGAGQLC